MISVVIVLYNSVRWLKGLEESIHNQTFKDFELIFVDNASSDGSLDLVKELFPNSVFIENKENLGYAYANNQGIKVAKGDYILLLNPDVELFNNTFELLLEYVEYGDIIGGINMPLEKKGVLDVNKVLEIFGDKPIKAHMVSGSMMLVKKCVFDSIGYLDEIFFLYWEDTEFCYRALSSGFRVVMVPVPYYHFSGGASNIRKNNYFADYNYFKSNMLFEYMRGKNPSLPLLITTYNTFKLKFKWKALVDAWRDYKKIRRRKEYVKNINYEYLKMKKYKDKVADKLRRYYAKAKNIQN